MLYHASQASARARRAQWLPGGQRHRSRHRPGTTARAAKRLLQVALGQAGRVGGQIDRRQKQVLETAAAGLPIRRLATAEEIAAVIGFLCSERASNVAGAAWSVDGGAVSVII
jgi:NAD(P)-dependent dehydrogenase (short-subunit alcohol dehydrogenase family)